MKQRIRKAKLGRAQIKGPELDGAELRQRLGDDGADAFGVLGPGRQARGNDVREALLRAGAELFGAYGVDGASTRDLAKMAGANLSSIRYHFGGKEGLYEAVLAGVARRFDELIGPTKRAVREELASLSGEADVKIVRAKVLELVGSMIAVMFSAIDRNKMGKSAERLIFREQTSATPWFWILYDGFMGDVIATFRALVERYVGREQPELEWVVRTHNILAQIIGFLVPREALVRTLGVETLSEEHRAAIVRVVTRNVEACLEVWADDLEKSPKLESLALKLAGKRAKARVGKPVKSSKAAKSGMGEKEAEGLKAAAPAERILNSPGADSISRPLASGAPGRRVPSYGPVKRRTP